VEVLAMRIRELVSVMALGFVGLHCASEKPAPSADENIVDNHPGALVITEPARAAFIEGDDGADVEVKGTGASPDVTVNGQHPEVAPDGSFHLKLKAKEGLNLITAVDGESRLESPFLFGHFISATTPVSQALALELGKAAIDGPPPAGSLTSILNSVIKDQDLLAAIRGKTFSGDVSLATWSYKVDEAKYTDPAVGLGPVKGGIAVNAGVKNLLVDGTLSVKAFGRSLSRPVKLTADKATVKGDAKLTVDGDKLKGAMPAATVALDNFKWDSGNAGFPCCVDAIISNVLEPKIEDAMKDAVREQVPKALALSLDGIGLPKELDLAAAGLKNPLAISVKFDGVEFDNDGGAVSAAVLFGTEFPAGSPGKKAPGWLKLGAPGRGARPAALGISFSVNMVNQLLFAAWGGGAMSRTVGDMPPVKDLKINPALPPVLTVVEDGSVRIGLGEVIVEATLGANAFTAALTVTQDVVPRTEGDALVLDFKGEPNLSITWLKADDVADSVRNIVATAVKEQIGKFLKPMKLPVPAFSLDKLGPSFAGKSLAIEAPAIAVDRGVARVGLSGALSLKGLEAK
jgi:hypothetical protein